MSVRQKEKHDTHRRDFTSNEEYHVDSLFFFLVVQIRLGVQLNRVQNTKKIEKLLEQKKCFRDQILSAASRNLSSSDIRVFSLNSHWKCFVRSIIIRIVRSINRHLILIILTPVI